MNFKEALDNVAEKINGPKFKDYLEKNEPETIQHLPILQDINKSGFLILNSQTGSYSKNDNIEYVKRSFITGFMLRNDASEFIGRVAIYTDKNAMCIAHCDHIDIPPTLAIPLSYEVNDNQIVFTKTFPSVLSTKEWNSAFEHVNLSDSEDVVMVFYWDTVWVRPADDKNGLFTNAVNLLKK